MAILAVAVAPYLKGAFGKTTKYLRLAMIKLCLRKYTLQSFS